MSEQEQADTALDEADHNPNIVRFKLSLTAQKFFADNRRMRFMTGPVGSGSSSQCSAELVRRAFDQAPGRDGVRRTRFAVVRNTHPELEKTCRKTFEYWFPAWDGKTGWGYWNENDMIFHLGHSASMRGSKKGRGHYCVAHPDGETFVYSEIMFISAGSYEETRQKFKSLELTGAWINEFKFLEVRSIAEIADRIDRYPPKKAVGGLTWTGIWGDTNPFDLDSEHYKAYVERGREEPDLLGFYKKPGGLLQTSNGDFVPNPAAENLENVGEDYYKIKLREYRINGRSRNDILRDLCGEFAYEVDGRAVFADHFNEERHVSKGPIKYDGDAGLVVGLDPGLTVYAAICCQKSNYGVWRALHELIEENMSASEFAPLLAYHCKSEYGLSPRDVTILADPAIKERSKTDLKPVVDVFTSCGFKVFASVKGLERIDSVRSVLQRHDGFKVCPRGCKTTIKGFLGGYHYERERLSSGDYKDKPKKNHPFSDIMDALQYAIAYYEAPVARGRNAREFPGPPGDERHSKRSSYTPKPFDPLAGMVR